MMTTKENIKKKVTEINLVLCLTFYLNSISMAAWEKKMYREVLHTFLCNFCFFCSFSIYLILSKNAEETNVKGNTTENFMLDCRIKTL